MSAYQTHPHVPDNQDVKHLNLLSIFHYVAGAFLALFGCCPLIYLLIGVVLVAGVVPVEETQPTQTTQTTQTTQPTQRYQTPDLNGPAAQQSVPSQQQGLGTMPPEYRTPPLGQSQQSAHKSQSDRNAQVAAGSVFIVISVIMVAAMWIAAIAIIVAGVNLRKRKAYTYCVVVGAIECLFMPLGTILGIFTLVTLTRPSVKAMFENPEAGRVEGPAVVDSSSEVKQWP